MSKKRSAESSKKAQALRASGKAAAGKTTHTSIPKPPIPPIVGIGASAGGLEAFTRFLKELPTNTGMAFVLVQHLEPTHKSVLTPLLARATKMPVREVSEGMHVEPNHVYVIPANADLSLLDGLLHIVRRKALPGRHLPIDYFFSSLAQSRGAEAIGVVLSGTGSDGTEGVKAIKKVGGVTFAQDPQTVRFDGMPRSAIASGCVDLTLSPEKIAKELARIFQGTLPRLPSLQSAPVPSAEEDDWIRLFSILRSGTGVDFEHYKKSTIKRRIASRMKMCKTESLSTYLKILESDQNEVHALFEDLLIVVTEFFRDSDAFSYLEKVVLPKILAEKPAGEPIRIWVAGCSSGEEVYSIAIAVLQSLGDRASRARIQIFGTDINELALEKARLGTYSAADVKRVPPKIVQRYFTPVNGNYQINESVRELCVFARHDLTRDPPFSKLDIISCRNVLIYLEPNLQKRILSAFHYGLRPSGVLILGKSENLGSQNDLFIAADRKNKFFKKIEGVRAPFALTRPLSERAQPIVSVREMSVPIDLESEVNEIVWERYSHAGIVVNGDLQIIHFLGDTSPYVRHVPGRASLQLMRTLRKEFVLEVRAALEKVRRGETAQRREKIVLHRNGNFVDVNVEVRLLPRSGPERLFLILFEQTGAWVDSHPDKSTALMKGQNNGEVRIQSDHSREVCRLRQELDRTREYVQAIIRDQEVTNEELKAANEEALSSMEELQSTNEELETAKEELQSSNEELVTLNEQLQNRNTELADLSTDLSNVLSGVDIPIVTLDIDQHIRRFTPPAEKLLGLISGDIGRPIGKLRLGLNVPNLDSLISIAIEKGEQAGVEVQTETGRWYSVRIRPFLAGDNKVQGVLMSFIDINELKMLEREARERAEESESTARALLESAAQAILACNRQGQIRLANVTAEKMFGYSREKLIGKSLESLIPERFRATHAKQRAAWFADPHSRQMGIGLDLAGLRRDGSEFPIEVSLSYIQTGKGTLAVAFVSDITERRKSERKLIEFSNQLKVEVEALQKMRRTNDELWRTHDLRAGLERILDDAIAMQEVDMGCIQVMNPESGTPEIVAHRGFGSECVKEYCTVSPTDDSVRSRRLRNGKQAIIEDVLKDADFAQYLKTAKLAGYRSVQSAPLLGAGGKLFGVCSVYCRKPHRPTDQEVLWLDLIANRAAQFIERTINEEKLQELSRAMIDAREENNREVARELHDVYSQDLVALGMELLSLSKEDGPDLTEMTRIAQLGNSVMDVAKRLHQTSRNLHPSVLEDLGLESALRLECESFRKISGIQTLVSARGIPSEVNPRRALCIYRLVQECLRNIQKHANETDRVWVTLIGTHGGIKVSVKDRGDGFELDRALKGGGLGLISIKERVSALGGNLNIESAPGKGTKVTAFLPVGGELSIESPDSRG